MSDNEGLYMGLALRNKAIAEGAQKGMQILSDAVDDRNERIRQLQLRLDVKTAHANGLQAYLDEIKRTSPNIPGLAQSGKRYKDGDPKSVGALNYEAAFDAYLKGKGIANPEKYRAD